MLIKMGVSVEHLRRPMRRALPKIDKIYKRYGSEGVITSTREGDHSPGSLHYSDEAVDCRRLARGLNREMFLSDMRAELGPDYDIVLTETYDHYEYDPKGDG